MSVITLNLNTTCRCCMRFDTDIGIQSIFDVTNNFAVPPVEQLRVCADIHIQKDDRLPKAICARCLVDLIKAYQFRSRCQKTSEVLAMIVPPVECIPSIPSPCTEPEETPETPLAHDDPQEIPSEPEETPPTLDELDRFMFDDQQILSTAFDNESTETQNLDYAEKQGTGESYIFEPQLKSSQSASKNSEKSVNVNHDIKKSLNAKRITKKSLNLNNDTPTLSNEVPNAKFVFNYTPPLSEKVSHWEDPADVICLLCQSLFITIAGAMSHLKNAHRLPPGEDLKQHIAKKTTTLFYCDVCHIEFPTINDMYKHKEDIHQLSAPTISCKLPNVRDRSKDINFMCMVCQRIFTSLKTFTNHIKKKHPHINQDSYHQHVKYLRVDNTNQTDMPNWTDQSNNDNVASIDEDKVLCDVCKKEFPSFRLLKTHFKKEHDPTVELKKEFRCDLCPIVTDCRSHLEIHKIKHSGEKSFKCEICAKCFKYSKDLIAHHKQKHRLNCPMCNMIFESATKLDDHKIAQHIELATKENSIILEDCAIPVVNYVTNQDLTSSLQATVMFKCSLCDDQLYTTKAWLKRHILTQHSYTGFILSHEDKIKNINIDDENKTNENENNKQKKKRIYKKKKDSKNIIDSINNDDINNFNSINEDNINNINSTNKDDINEKEMLIIKCNLCSFETTHRRNFSYHMKKHKTHPAKCEFCGLTVMSKQILQRHINLKHLGKPAYQDGRLFRCYMCGARFADKESLCEHRENLEIHKLHSCDRCNYTAYAKKFLARHVQRAHIEPQAARPRVARPQLQGVRKRPVKKITEYKPYDCPMCGDKFAQPRGLAKHQTSCRMFIL